MNTPGRDNYHLFRTATDGAIDLADPQIHQVSILDIAWSLSQLNRFYGHSLRPYSVAEHSLLVADILAARGLDVHAQLAGLMHDAHEAYCADLHPATKHMIGPAWAKLEKRMEYAVRSAFWLHTAAAMHADSVNRADQIALNAELRDLRGESQASQNPAHTVPGWVDLLTPERATRTWEGWRDLFVERFSKLQDARNTALDDAHNHSGYLAFDKRERDHSTRSQQPSATARTHSPSPAHERDSGESQT